MPGCSLVLISLASGGGLPSAVMAAQQFPRHISCRNSRIWCDVTAHWHVDHVRVEKYVWRATDSDKERDKGGRGFGSYDCAMSQLTNMLTMSGQRNTFEGQRILIRKETWEGEVLGHMIVRCHSSLNATMSGWRKTFEGQRILIRKETREGEVLGHMIVSYLGGNQSFLYFRLSVVLIFSL